LFGHKLLHLAATVHGQTIPDHEHFTPK
jgi:hypothetical protein